MKQYQDLLRDITENGEKHEDRTGIGTTSVFGRQLRFDLWNSFPLLTTKAMPFRWVAEELFWILSGSTNSKDLEAKGVDIWKEWADKRGELGPTYGFQLRNFGAAPTHEGYDQIEWLCSALRNHPNSRRLILTYWNPEQLNDPGETFPPCHVSAQFRVHEERRELSCHLFQRSADAFLGLPFDIAGYALLTTLLAEVSWLTPRELVISIGDAHIYSNHKAAAQEILAREPKPLPELKILDPTRNIKGRGFEGLMLTRFENLKLVGYDPHEKISAPVAK